MGKPNGTTRTVGSNSASSSRRASEESGKLSTFKVGDSVYVQVETYSRERGVYTTKVPALIVDKEDRIGRVAVQMKGGGIEYVRGDLDTTKAPLVEKVSEVIPTSTSNGESRYFVKEGVVTVKVNTKTYKTGHVMSPGAKYNRKTKEMSISIRKNDGSTESYSFEDSSYHGGVNETKAFKDMIKAINKRNK